MLNSISVVVLERSLCAGFILACVVRVKNENGWKFTHKN